MAMKVMLDTVTQLPPSSLLCKALGERLDSIRILAARLLGTA